MSNDILARANRKHLIWVIGLIVITSLLCGTALWINSHSFTFRFEMDDNTKEAIQSINWSALDSKNCICTDYNIGRNRCCEVSNENR